MEELKDLLKNNVDGDKTGLQDHVLSILHNEAKINALSCRYIKFGASLN